MAGRENSGIMLRATFAILVLSCFIGCNSDAKETDQEPDFNVANFSEFLEKIEEVDSSDRQEIVNAYIDTLSTVPIVENQEDAYFIYSGSATSVQVAGDFNGWNPAGKNFVRIDNTDLWYRKESFEPNARLDYKLVLSGSNWVLDPKNPNTISGGFGPNSELAMPGYEQPWEIVRDENLASGEVVDRTILSVKTGKNYNLKVYLPPNYSQSTSYPTTYFQDGGEYLSLASASTTLDNLIGADLISPIIGVFVVPSDRNTEYAFADRIRYREFFVEELVPYIDEEFSTIPSAESRAVLGDSFGGNISALIAFNHPAVFGNCGIHSGAFQPNDFETNDLVMDGIKKNIKVASIWGSYEGGLATNMESVKDYLSANDYDITWKELPEGHSWGLWRATIDDMLIFFFPKN